MERYPRPRILVSKCLGFAKCRWNGETISDPFTTKLESWVEFIPVCPEVEVGLGVPRDPVRLVEGPEGLRLVQPASGRDLTEAMLAYADGLPAGLGQVEGLLLKSRSPSCGPQDVKIYTSGKQGSASRRGQGLFAQRLRMSLPQAACEHEGRVQNFHLREHFLARVFAMARLRRLAERPAMGALVEFHAGHKLVLMAYNQTLMRKMGRLVANAQGLPPAQALIQYQELLAQAMARAPKAPAVINVLMHALGYFKKAISGREKAYFMELLEQYRQGRLPLRVAQGVVMAWALRFDVEYLARQSFFAPYPQEIFDMADSGKGRDLQ